VSQFIIRLISIYIIQNLSKTLPSMQESNLPITTTDQIKKEYQ
jgi:hypothetical protein